MANRQGHTRTIGLGDEEGLKAKLTVFVVRCGDRQKSKDLGNGVRPRPLLGL